MMQSSCATEILAAETEERVWKMFRIIVTRARAQIKPNQN